MATKTHSELYRDCQRLHDDDDGGDDDDDDVRKCDETGRGAGAQPTTCHRNTHNVSTEIWFAKGSINPEVQISIKAVDDINVDIVKNAQDATCNRSEDRPFSIHLSAEWTWQTCIIHLLIYSGSGKKKETKMFLVISQTKLRRF